MEEKIKLGILGATGMAGREAVLHQQHLDEQGLQYAELAVVTGSSSSAGKKLGDVFEQKETAISEQYDFWEQHNCPEEYENMEVRETDPEVIAEKADYVISALPSSVAAEVEPELRDRGVHVFSNASEFRWGENVPLMIPGANPEQIEMVEKQDSGGVQVNNPNCTTSGFVPVLAALDGITNVNVTTMQSISGKGDRIASREYAEQIRGNVRDDWSPESTRNNEEKKSETEPQKILGNAFTVEEAGGIEKPMISAQTARVATQYGHLETLRIEFNREVDAEEIRRKLEKYEVSEKVQKLPSTADNAIKLFDRQVEPRKDVFDNNGMNVCVSDIRNVSENEVCMFTLSHNLRRGATWTARQSLELYLDRYEGIKFNG